MSAVEPGYLRKILPDGPPEEGESWSTIQNDIESKILPGITHWFVTFDGQNIVPTEINDSL